jgi:hypothetical protein
MKKPPSKADIRRQLEQQVDTYVDQGGKVKQIQRGISGRSDTSAPLRGNTAFSEPRKERTSMHEVVARLEARRRPNARSKPRPSPRRTPQKVAVYDEFGEIVRWVWSDQ